MRHRVSQSVLGISHTKPIAATSRMASQALAHAARLSFARRPPSPAALGTKGRPSLLLYRSTAGSSSASASASGRRVEPPNLTQLCEKAHLYLTPEEIANFTPKIASVVDWLSQLQDVDVGNVAPAVRVGELGSLSTLRADVPVIFEGGEAMLAAAPEREGPYLKVPRILRENTE